MRILVTIVSIGLVAILVLSNLSPPIAITFLSRQTVALPMGLWLLGTVIVGFLSSLAVRVLLNLQQRRLLNRLRQLERELDRSAPEFNFRSTNSALEDDWGDAPNQRAEDEDDEDIDPAADEYFAPEDDDEYLEPDSRGEVVDAGFRVIRPPETDEPSLRYTPPPPDRSTSRDGEDWGFDFDEDDRQEDRSSSRRKR